MFLDEVEFNVSAGAGGAGSASLHRERFQPRGGPDGGDGGRGGDVVVAAEPGLSSLGHLLALREVRALAGSPGGGSRRHGAAGRDRVVAVPAGTLAWDVGSGRLLADLDRPGLTAVLARGGRGGKGNVHFASATNQAPRRRELGEPGRSRRVRLELRLIADIGLVGMPNSGKSTLLARLTGAHPKIADYPFTTLSPNLGVAELPRGLSLTLADVPGLIAGAHRGQGLGLAFLRHLMRTRALIHLLDAAQGLERLVTDYETVRGELARHDPELVRRPTLLVLNKLDLLSLAEGERRLQQFAEGLGADHPVVLGVSAKTGVGCRRLEETLLSLVGAAEKAPQPQGESGFRLYRGPQGLRRDISVAKEGGGYRVMGEALERMVAMTDLEDGQALRSLQRRLLRLGVEKALRQAGAESGAEVWIGESSFTLGDDPQPPPPMNP
ncbi:MAG: GTPase ObgE [Candidatus Dormibacteria bacterium]